MGHYTPGPNRHCEESVDGHVMCACVEMTVHGPWSQWAKMITKANLWEFERPEAVREMLGALISQKNKSCLNGSELREAAEKALEWTRRDEQNHALSRLRNSLEYKSCLNAIASGKIGRKLSRSLLLWSARRRSKSKSCRPRCFPSLAAVELAMGSSLTSVTAPRLSSKALRDSGQGFGAILPATRLCTPRDQ
jgi:hypothetical protein